MAEFLKQEVSDAENTKETNYKQDTKKGMKNKSVGLQDMKSDVCLPAGFVQVLSFLIVKRFVHTVSN